MVANPTRWIGTESGYAPDPTWSTCDFNSSGAGDPSSPDWYPAEVDFTTLDGDTWFYQPGVPVRSPGVLRAMYERSVGHNAVALIGIGIPPNGSMAGTEQAAALAKLGAYVSGCYGAAVVSAADQPAAVITLMPSAPSLIDRVVVDEDQTQGQLIRGWAVALLLTNGTEVQVDAGMSIGNRHITVLDTPLDVVQATLNITATVAPTRIAYFGLYAGCGDLARDLDAAAAKR